MSARDWAMSVLVLASAAEVWRCVLVRPRSLLFGLTFALWAVWVFWP